MKYEPTYLGDIELSEEILTHYGVKGMKWRRRKTPILGSSSDGNLYWANKRRRNAAIGSSKRKHLILGDRGDGQMDWADKKRKNAASSRPTSRRRNITGSGSGAYRKGSGLGSDYRTRRR